MQTYESAARHLCIASAREGQLRWSIHTSLGVAYLEIAKNLLSLEPSKL